MKKSELTHLTQIIEILVIKEIRKQLPQLIGEVFQNMAGKSLQQPIVEHIEPRQEYIGKEIEQPAPKNDPHEFRASLKELFAGVTPVTRHALEVGEVGEEPSKPSMRHYTNDPVLNQILNETVPDLRSRERMTGMAAFQGGYNPNGLGTAVVGAGEMMPETEMPSFARNMSAGIPIGTPPVLREGQESTHAPLSALPEGISALDVAKTGMIPPAVTEVLTNYDRMKKVLEASKGRR